MLPSRQTIDVAGLRIAYRTDGEGVPVILLHGFFGDSRVWRRQLALADSHRVVAWDAPGCGGSVRPPQSFRLADYADCLAGFISTVGLERPHLVGNSFGGSLALELEARHPGTARSLVLVDAYAGWSGSFSPDVVAARLASSLPDLELPSEQVVSKWLPGFVTPQAPQHLRKELAAIIADFDPEGMRPMIRALAEADLRAALPQIAVPTLLIWGQEDVRSPVSVGESLQQSISGSKLIVLQAAGHLSMIEAADGFNAELRTFFRKLDTGRR